MITISRFLPSYFFTPVDPEKRLENAVTSIKNHGFDFKKDYGMKT